MNWPRNYRKKKTRLDRKTAGLELQLIAFTKVYQAVPSLRLLVKLLQRSVETKPYQAQLRPQLPPNVVVLQTLNRNKTRLLAFSNLYFRYRYLIDVAPTHPIPSVMSSTSISNQLLLLRKHLPKRIQMGVWQSLFL